MTPLAIVLALFQLAPAPAPPPTDAELIARAAHILNLVSPGAVRLTDPCPCTPSQRPAATAPSSTSPDTSPTVFATQL